MYELAYHLKQHIEEAERKTHMQEVESLLVQYGATIIASREPKETRLSYPIAHEHGAYMGVIDFTGPTDMIAGINSQLQLQESILRFLIISKPEDKDIRMFGEQRSRKMRTHTAPSTTAIPKKEVTPGEEKEMEKKLEDVLEKI